jgi:hypothetical protein
MDMEAVGRLIVGEKQMAHLPEPLLKHIEYN